MIYHYLKSFLRSVKRNRFFYSVNLIGFLTGFLLLTVIFTFVYQELSFDRFHKNINNIYRIHSGGYGVTPLCFAEKLQNKIPEISGIIRFSQSNLTIISKNKKVEIGKVYFTDPEIFRIFSFKLLSGDTSNVLKSPFSIVINNLTAIKLFGKSTVIGESIQDKDGTIFTIKGVMEDIPYNSHIQSNAFISIETLKHIGDDRTFNCGSWGHLTYIWLSEKSNYKEAEVKINEILKDSRMGFNENKFVLMLQPLKKVYFDAENNKFDGSKHGSLQTVIIYFAISILILFIVMVNYINLSMAIFGSRIKEVAIRKIIGANKGQIVKQVLLESLTVSFLSFMVALLFIELMLPKLSSLLNIPIYQSQNRSILYMFYFVGISFIGLVTGLIPGFSLSKIREINALKNESFLCSNGYQRKILLAFQLLIVAVLLNSTIIINNQLRYIFNKDLGFRYENVVYFNLSKDLLDKKELLKDNLLKNPKIEFVSFSYGLIGDEFTKGFMKIDENEKFCSFYSVDPDYFNLYKMKIKYGRNFSWNLKTDIDNSCIINEELCRVFGLKNPINKKIGNKTIIGLVEDFNFSSLHKKVEPLVINWWNNENVVQIKISKEKVDETLLYIQRSCKDISPDFECNYSFLNNRIKELYKPEIRLKESFVVYSTVTFLIALLGLFGVTLFMIKKMIKEICLRKLFGSSLKDTFILLSKEQVWIVVFSNILAIPISYLLMSKWLDNFQFRVDIGSLIFIKTFLITLTFTLAAIAFIIIKTHRISPMSTLKQE